MKDAEYYMAVVRTFKGILYHIIELPFERIEDATSLAKKRMKEYPEGKQRIIPSKTKKFWAVYEKISWDHMPEQHRHPKGGKK